MEFKSVKQNFKVVALKGNGAYAHLGEEVPLLAKQLLSRSNEIEDHLGVEIALFEPKRNRAHQEGEYFVGLIVNKRLKEVPTGMDFIEMDQQYITARGKISSISTLHSDLIKWADEQGYKRNLDSYIVETYHPKADEEEVQIYLPIF